MNRSDPTAIDINFDPQQQRMRGVAIHGNTPFDVPYVSEIVPGLWQGGCRDGLRLPKTIKHVVSLYPWESYSHLHDLRSELAVRMYDSADQQFGQVDAIAEWVNGCRADAPTLVHCQAGLNRSGLVAARALMLGPERLTAEEAVALLRAGRSPAVLCNASFVSWLRSAPALALVASGKGACSVCGRVLTLTKRGVLRMHGREREAGQRSGNCLGAGELPELGGGA